MINNTCTDICGDGRVFTLECDDGNLIDGDGCSHECKNEYFYKCTEEDEYAASECSYRGMKIDISLTSIEKVEGENQGIFTFTFKPLLLNLAKLDLKGYFFFSCEDANYTI